MSELKKYINVERSSEKNFGIVFSVVFLLIGIYPVVDGNNVRLWAIILSILFFALAFLVPNTLSFPNKVWFKLGMILGAIIAPDIMALVYFTTVVPVGLTMRLLGKDPLNQKLDKDSNSYWIERKQPVGSMKNQF